MGGGKSSSKSMYEEKLRLNLEATFEGDVTGWPSDERKPEKGRYSPERRDL